jgi:hypothetical protein
MPGKNRNTKLKRLLGRTLPVFPLALLPSIVFAQEAEVALGTKIFIAALPVILGAAVLYYLLRTDKK